MFAALAEHLSAALIALYVDATHGTLFNHCISVSTAQSNAETTDRACLCKVRGCVMNELFMWKWVTLTCLLTVPSVAAAGSRNDHLSRGFCSRSRRRHGMRGREQEPVCLRYRASHCTRPGSPKWGTKLYWGPTELLNETKRKSEENPSQAGNACKIYFLIDNFSLEISC